MAEKEKVEVEDIIGLVKTDEPTDSVEEVRKLRGREGMVEKPKETPKEELECPKKYVYDTGIIFECKDGCKFQILDEDVVKLLNELTTKCSQLEKENEQLKKEISIFEGEDAGHYQRWVAQIKKYVDESNPNFEYDEDFIIKIALSYTLQSLRNGESLKRFQWEYKELGE